MMHDHETITLTLQPLPSNVAATVRLRAALKTLLRTYRLRCVSIGSPPDPNAQDNAGSEVVDGDDG